MFLNEFPLLNRRSIISIIWQRALKLSPEAFWIFLGQVGTAIVGLLGIKVLTYLLDPSEFGKLALASTAVSLISTNLFSPLGQGLMRFWAISREGENLGGFYAISNRYREYVTYISGLVATVLIIAVGLSKGIDWALLVAFSFGVGVASGWLDVIVSIFTAARKRRWIAFLNIGNAFFRLAIGALLIILIASSASWVMVGYLLATFLIFVVAESLYRRIVSEVSPPILKIKQSIPLFQGLGRQIFSYSCPFVIWGMFNWVYMSCDRWSLQAFYGEDIVGAFAVVSSVATYPIIFGSSFLSTLFTPIVFQRAGDLKSTQNIDSANKILWTMVGVYIIGIAVLIALYAVFHHPLILLISNVHFARFSYLLPWLTVAWGLFYLGQALFSFAALANKPWSYLIPKCISSIVAGAGTFYLSARIGPAGVVWGLALAGLVYVMWCMIVVQKLVRNPATYPVQNKD
jgi:O-antigen/teichoic acid export membrane protein